MEEYIIKELDRLSEKALMNDDVPISCIITRNNKIIAKDYNKKIKNNDPLAHAEILCIKKATKKLKTNNLNDCELYCSLYPCNMCIEVINEVRIKKVHYLLDKEKVVNSNIVYKKMNTNQAIIDKFRKKIKYFFSNKR
jgi:tRNA(adenine34) deaminase